MTYAVVDILPSWRGFDTVEQLTSAQYAAMAAIGFKFRWLYLGDQVCPDEIAKATSNGIGIVAIQHARGSGWLPDSTKGAEDGARAVRDASTGQLPHGLALWCDLEGCGEAATFADVDAYAKTWCAAVVASGHPAEVYVGSAVPGSELQLWELPFTGYGKSFSNVVTPAKRDFKMLQLFASYPKGECFVRDYEPSAPPSIAYLNIDIDVAQCDYLGARPKMLVRAP